jgi:DNA (cytosine-5)-methyltransferase 1
LVPHISETEFGYWPTPTAAAEAPNVNSNKRHGPLSLLEVAREWWPTPTVDGANNVTRKSGQFQSLTRAVMWPTPTVADAEGGRLRVAVKLWPTPSAEDHRDRGNLSTPAIQRRFEKGKQLNLSMVVSEKSGALNPTWVEWLMGYPIGWTDFEDSATPLSRRSWSG